MKPNHPGQLGPKKPWFAFILTEDLSDFSLRFFAKGPCGSWLGENASENDSFIGAGKFGPEEHVTSSPGKLWFHHPDGKSSVKPTAGENWLCVCNTEVVSHHREQNKTKQKQLQLVSCLGKKAPKPQTAFPFHKQFSAKRKRSFVFCEPTEMSYSPVRKSHLYYGMKDVFLIQKNGRALHETAFGGKGKGVLLLYKENSLLCLGRRNCSKK